MIVSFDDINTLLLAPQRGRRRRQYNGTTKMNPPQFAIIDEYQMLDNMRIMKLKL